MINPFKWLHRKTVPQPAEVLACLAFLKNGKAGVEQLTKLLNERAEPFQAISPFNWVGVAGLIRVESDVYGYEVKLGHHINMLDCNPNTYGLTSEEAKPLYEAILSCVPGSCLYQDKMLRLRYPNCQHPEVVHKYNYGAFAKQMVTKCALCGVVLETGGWEL